MHIHSKGNEIGYHRGEPVHQWITFATRPAHPDDTTDPRLLRFHFDRVALEDRDGRIMTSQLKEGEIMLHPGLIYA